MKIAIFLERFPCLSETFILSQITGLLDRGHAVDVYARTADQGAMHEAVARYGLRERTRYYAGYGASLPGRLARYPRALGLLASRAPGRAGPLWRALDPRRFGRQALSLRTFYSVARFADFPLASYDVVHCHFGPKGNLAAELKAAGAIRGPVLTTFWGYDLSRYVRERGRAVYRPLFTGTEQVLAISQYMADELRALGCPPEKLRVHHSGVSLRGVTARPRQPGPAGRVTALSVARLVEKKGLADAIRAVAACLPEFPELEYVIIGGGPLRADLEALIAALGAEGRIRLLGPQPQEVVLAHMDAAHVLLAPSVTAADGDQEGVPTVLMEALARGLPALATWHTGIPEVVEDGVSGYLVNEHDVPALTDRLTQFLRAPERWPALGQAGRAHIERHHDIDQLNDQLVQLYRELLERRPVRG